MHKIKLVYKKLFKKFGKQEWWPVSKIHECSLEKRMFEVIIGAILTQNTSWKNAEKAIENLIKEDLIDIQKIKKISKKKLAKLIRPSGYFNQKAERLKIFADYVIKKYSGHLTTFMEENPKKIREELLNIKGIGPETADSIMLYAFQKPTFVIDMYTKRIFSRLGVVEECIAYDDLQQMFHKNLKEDVEVFNEYHALIVEFAKQFCTKKPQCAKCPLNKECKTFIYKN